MELKLNGNESIKKNGRSKVVAVTGGTHVINGYITNQQNVNHHGGRPKEKEITGIFKNRKDYMEMLWRGYQNGDFRIAGDKPKERKKKAQAPFSRFLFKAGIFVTEDGTPLSYNTLIKDIQEIRMETGPENKCK